MLLVIILTCQLATAKPLYWCFKKKGLLICDSDTRLQEVSNAMDASGYFGVGHYKTLMRGFDLQKWNPNIVYEAYNENAHDFVEDHQEVINECDVLIVAVASVPVEHHINRLIIENKITIPVVFIWVEPYSLGGHAILVKEPQDLYRDVFDKDTLQYKNSIVQNASDYLKREAGCQSTYMPYSGFLLQQFIYRVLEQIMSVCCQKRGNYRLTWCGRLSDARKQIFGMWLSMVRCVCS